MKARHRTYDRRRRCWGLWLVLAMAAGCHDPRFEAKQAMRDRRIAHVLDGYAARERRRPASIERIHNVLDTLGAHRADCRDRAHRLIEESRRCRRRRWLAQAEVRRERIRSIIEGDLESIPGTFGKLFY